MAPASLVRKLMNPKKRASPPAKRKTTATRRKKKRSPKKKKSATVTPSKKKNKQTNKPKGDVCEYAPTSRAACQGCHKKIQQGQARVGKEEFYPQTQSYIHRYYHVPCYQRAFPGQSPKLHSKRSMQDELHHLRQEQAQATRLVHERVALRHSLEALRTAFAKRLHRSAVMIFPDATLNDLIVKLPRNKTEMLKVHGIAEQRYKNFGTCILQIIHQYRMSCDNSSQVGAASSSSSPRDSKPKAKATTKTRNKRQRADDDDDDDDDDYIPEAEAVAVAAVARPSKRKASTSRKTSNDGTGKAPKEVIVIDDTTSSDDEDNDDDVFFDAKQEVEIDDDDDFDEDGGGGGGVMMGKSLSAEEIVQRKFDHAAKNNYIISVD